MSDENTLSSRQKGDIYWRKRIYYISAAELKGGIHEGYLNKDTAEDALDSYESLKDTGKWILPMGREFLACPPSAAGHKLFSESVASLMVFRDYLKRLLSGEEASVSKVFQEIFGDGIESLKTCIDKVIEDYFGASGMDLTGKPIEDKALIKKKRESFAHSRKAYEEKLHEYYYKYGFAIIENIRGKTGIGERVPVSIDPIDREFEDMIAEDPGGVILYEDSLDNLRTKIYEVRKEAAERIAAKDKLREDLLRRYFTKDIDPLIKSVVIAVSMELRNDIEERLKKLTLVRAACFEKARELLMDEPEDAAKYMKAAQANVEFYDEPIGGEELLTYGEYIPKDYHGKIKAGTFNASAVFNSEDKELYGVFVSNVHSNWLELIWLYLRNPEGETHKKGRFVRYAVMNDMKRRGQKLYGAFLEIHMDEAWPDTEEALRLSGIECRKGFNNIYEFSLSEFQDPTSLKSAAERRSCQSLLNVDFSILAKLDTMIKNEDRPIPVPVFVDWGAYIPNISFVCVKNGEPCGVILFTGKEDYLIVELFYSTDTIALASLLYHAFEAAVNEYGGDKKVLVPIVINKSAALVERLVPTAGRGQIIHGIMRF